VRAVNLIPADQRRGAGGIGGRSGGVVYVLTGGLAVLVLLGVIYALAVHDVHNKNSQLAVVTQQVNSVTSEAQALSPYVQFAATSANEVSQVNLLADSRFDWPTAMRQLALALPGDVTLTSFSATAGSGPVNTSGETDTAFILDGCATRQSETAEVLTRLASVPGVDSVALTNTIEDAKPGKSGAAGAPGGAAGGCPYVMFSLAVNYAASYTIPDTKTSTASRPGQTVSSASSPTVSTAAKQQTTGVAP
jgi:hypothetical protein